MSALSRTWVCAWREAWANQRSFWTQITIMVLNDVVWIVFWIVFFDRVGEVRGWDVDDLVVLLAVLTTSAGAVLGLLNNSRRIGQLAADGGLDAALALPTPTLPHLLVRSVEPTNVGDLVFGLALFAFAGDPTPGRTLVFLVGVAFSTLLLTGFLVIMGSLSFFIGRNEAGDLGFQAALLFSSYPVDIFAGSMRLFLYAVVPAGFISAAPSRLVDDFDPAWAAGVVGVSMAFALAGWMVFRTGLRRYTSGAVWTTA